MGVHSSLILAIYYFYEFGFHLLTDNYLVPNGRKNSYFKQQIIMIMHELCDLFVITSLVVLVSQHTFRNYN